MIITFRHTYIYLSVFFLTMVLTSQLAVSQIFERVYQSDYKIEQEKEGELSLEFDNITFFKNNEFQSDIVEGYTLPGLRLQMKVVYYPLHNIRLEAGVHSLYYHGSTRYPSYAYSDIARWNPDHYQHLVHLLPFFRAQVKLSESMDIVLGNIYGGANHQLITPLYNPELNLTADPEAGLQVLYKSNTFDLDTWVNWESFIFKGDTHQEAFTAGLSTRLKFNNPESRFHIYMPIQGVAQHRGGELDTITANSVHTLMNGSVGVGLTWNTGHLLFKNVNIEADMLGYYQQAGTLWPLNDGGAYYISASADISDFRLKTGYLKNDNFISMFGTPLYGAASTIHGGRTYKTPSTIHLGLEYSRSFGKGYNLGVELELYNVSASGVNDVAYPELQNNKISGTSFTAGVYLRVNPSFLLSR